MGNKIVIVWELNMGYKIVIFIAWELNLDTKS